MRGVGWGREYLVSRPHDGPQTTNASPADPPPPHAPLALAPVLAHVVVLALALVLALVLHHLNHPYS